MRLSAEEVLLQDWCRGDKEGIYSGGGSNVLPRSVFSSAGRVLFPDELNTEVSVTHSPVAFVRNSSSRGTHTTTILKHGAALAHTTSIGSKSKRSNHKHKMVSSMEHNNTLNPDTGTQCVNDATVASDTATDIDLL